MLISLRKKFIFIANLKTASTAIEAALRHDSEIALLESGFDKHAPLSVIETKFAWIFQKVNRKDFFVFGVMRDPVDFVVSVFNSHCDKRFKESPTLYTGDMEFDQFISEWAEANPEQLKPQYTRFLSRDGSVGANYIISYANLRDGLKYAGARIGIAKLPELSSINVSEARLARTDLTRTQLDWIAARFQVDERFMARLCDRPLSANQRLRPDNEAAMPDAPTPFGNATSAATAAVGAAVEETIGSMQPGDEEIRALYRHLLLREPDPDGLAAHVQLLREGNSFEQILHGFLYSREFAQKGDRFAKAYFDRTKRHTDDTRQGPEPTKSDFQDSWISDHAYRCPGDLTITPLSLRRVVVIGQCLVVAWPNVIERMMPGCKCDFFLFNRVQRLPEHPPAEPSQYDFQLVNLPLRSVLPDEAFFRLSYGDPEAYEDVFRESSDRLGQFLEAAMRWNREHGLLTFVTNFILPQQNPMGRLLPRYDLRNLVYFVERLNETLAEELGRFNNAFLFDLDQIITTFGRKYCQDDVICISNHNGMLSDYDFDYDQDRLEPPVRASTIYERRVGLVYELGLRELLAMYRTIRQLDMVKLVVMDLDDTLWRGVAAECTEHSSEAIEGWPIGLAEALGHLKRRGVLLALISKNEEKLILPIWQRLFEGRLSVDDFAIRKINWRPKAENFEEILQETNLLPRSTVYIDDNPVERAAIEAAFPGVRTFGPNPLVWRRILLWSAETQVATITKESASRTELVRAQVERETQRKQLSREDFLASLQVEVALRELDDVEHPEFTRALELINKSNQFNTTGKRRTKQEFHVGFANGVRLFIFDVKDRFTSYGIVGVIIVEEATIIQFVMSCRVVGMEVEIAAITQLLRIMQKRVGTVRALLKETELNLLARDLWERCGFKPQADQWVHSRSSKLTPPSHVKVLVAASASATLEPVTV